MKHRLVLAGLVAVAMPSIAIADPLVVGIDALKEWNLIVLGDLTSSSEVEGRTFVGGNLSGNSSNYQIRTVPASTYALPGLTVVGDVLGGTKNLNNGSGALVGGNVQSGFNLNGGIQTVKVGGSLSNTNINQNVVQSGLGNSDPGFVAGLTQQKTVLASSMTDLSNGYAALSPTAQVSIAGNRATFNAVANADGVGVFNLTAADLTRFGEIAFNTNGADTVIVNVSGSAIQLNDNFLGNATGLGEHVIWNFPDATSLTLSTAWKGSVLAPKAAAVTGNYIEGSAVFGSLIQNGEFHLGTYIGTYTPTAPNPPSSSGGSSGGGSPTPVPEPGSLLMMAVGLGLMAMVAWRRRSVSA
ncbi:choice-of-anchor A family protein [Sphingomonas sp. SORGH_AS_0879]|uniref:choice-of-anchor A family protein n=1 Tax=Sphingomonas sp. SORGH_AS_0879 TaxID=3041790 RepID=UPI00277E5745|nr:choice-of-anchor A family protein [Sphingomonas sp. SORGH_AS_0879]MDQ1230015.1 choice-of-anchor A domain-containing protein [Sphingomonas sp. SORGH_AS_0879]